MSPPSSNPPLPLPAKKRKVPPKTKSFHIEPPKKKKSKKKQPKEPAKLPWDQTLEECVAEAQRAVDEHFKKKEPEKKTPIDPKDKAFFLKMTDANRHKFIPPSDYDCSTTKSYEKKKRSARSLSDVPQLGTQKKQSIELLVVLPTVQQGLIEFLATSRLSVAQVAGGKIENHPIVPR
ncbi:hypothetical protein C2845_PM01G44130 [Panicum miliaceum]|uniref:Uncharacterized protein n=1 Tax=Panicum miliaceum TaxID=4540 RepID=A0A3L6TMG1_PANMI|nr:hypothetical protein C2845_PM01G44130 [Panicum miliaceum]